MIADEHDIAHVSCFTVNPHGHCKYPGNIAKMISRQDLPDSVYIGGAFCKVINLTFLIFVITKTAGDSHIQHTTVDPLYVALNVPHLAQQQNTFVQTALKNIMSSSEALPSY